MKRRTLTGWLIVVTLISMALLPIRGPSAIAASPQPKTLTGTMPDVVSQGSAQLLGRKSSTDMVGISIGLPLRSVDQLNSFLRSVNDPSSSNYHHFLNLDAANRQFNPTVEDEQRVVTWLQSHGMTVTATFPNHLMVDAQGTVSEVERLLQVSLNRYRVTVNKQRREFYAPDRNPTIDASVSSSVDSITGLDNLPRFHTGLTSNGTAHNVTPYFPQDIANAYDTGPLWSGGYTGTGQHIGITLWMAPPSDTTLQKFGSTTGAAVATVGNGRLNVIHVCDNSTGTNNCTSTAPDSGEAGLDVEWSGAVAPGATIDYYEVPTDSSGNPTALGLLNALNQAGTDAHSNGQITNSWGECEPTSAADSFSSQAETILASNSVTGHNYFFSTGDSGSSCGTDPHADFPASSPYVTSVGGTSFKASVNGSYPGETAWKYTAATSTSSPVGSGGGYSALYARPSWQTGTGLGANAMRGYPDVSSLADPNTGVYGCYGATPSCVQFGGTSLSSPLWAGMVALINQYLAGQSKPALGFLDPTLANLANQSQAFAPFYDIVSGTNGKYTAAIGWDAVTGWGTPNAWNIARDLAGAPAVTSTPTATATSTPTAVATTSPTSTATGTATPPATATVTSTFTATPKPTSTSTSTSTGTLSAGYSLSGQPTSFSPGGSVTYSVTVTNTGTTTWQAGGSNPVHLGIHFVTGSGAWASDQRWALPSDLAPNGSATISVIVTAPTTGGTYTLQEQMVQEGISWFSQHLNNSVTIGTTGGPALAAQYSVNGQPTSFAPGGGASYSVTVTNTGSATWQAGGTNPIHLGIHFVNGNGTWATDQRWALPNDLGPGQNTTINVLVTAPTSAGTYTLQEQMVQEGITWFSQHMDYSVTVGNSTTTCPGSQSGCVQAMLNQLNSDRSAAGVAALTLNSTETNGTSSCVGSYGHSVHMAQFGSISHDQFPADICIAYSIAGENVGESSSGNEWTDLQTLDNQMMAEPHTAATCSTTNNHACNIINGSFHQVGIGVYNVNNVTWLTEDFTN